MRAQLTATEQQKLKAIKNTLKQTQFIASRVALKLLVMNHLKIQLNLHYASSGKPLISNTGYHCAISHSNNAIMVAISPHDIGIDIELCKPRNTANLIQYLGEHSASPLNTDATNITQLKDFYAYWTRHEAALKLFGDTTKHRKLSEHNFYQRYKKEFSYAIAQDQTVTPHLTTLSHSQLLP